MARVPPPPAAIPTRGRFLIVPDTPAMPSSGFRRLAVVAAITSLVVIAIGGATRATDSGLACPTWPGCFSGGDFLPPVDVSAVDGLGRSVSGINVWLEHSHRLVAGVLGLMVAALLVWVLARHRRTPGLLWPVVGAAVAVNVQALLGALVVWNLVKVELVTTHLGLGTATMALLVYVAARSQGPLRRPSRSERLVRMWRFAAVVTGVLWLQILVGGHLTGVMGGLAFVNDPALGLFSIGPITMEPEAVNVVHRYLGFVVAGLAMATAGRMRRAGIGGAAQAWARVAASLTGLQVLLGVANLWSSLSFLSVIPHLAVASWILAAMVMVLISLCRADEQSAVDVTTDTLVEVPA